MRCSIANQVAEPFFNETHYSEIFTRLSEPLAHFEVLFDETGRPGDLKFVFVNSAYEKQFGCTAGGIAGARVTELFPAGEDEAFRLVKRIGQTAVTHKVQVFETFLTGTRQWYRVSAFNTLPGHVGVFFYNITAKKRTEEALTASELKYRLLFDNIDDAVMMIDIGDKPGRVCEVNEGACRKLGYNPEELLRLSVKDIHVDFTDEVLHNAIADLKAKGAYIRERTHKAKDGTRISVEVCAKYFVIEGKEFCLAVYRDLRARISTEKIIKASYERMRRNNLLNELIDSETLSRQQARELVLTTGLKIFDSAWCHLIVVDSWMGKSHDYWQQRPSDLCVLMNSIIELLEGEKHWAVWASPHGIGVLSDGAGGGRGEKDFQEEEARRLQEIIYSNIPELAVKIGISANLTNINELRGLYRQSFLAVDAGRKAWPERDIFHYLDIGIFQVLPLIGRREMSSYVERKLGPLLDYEKRKKSELLPTLEAILDSRSFTEAAKRLFVHQKTLDFRRRRIEQLLGKSLDCQESRTALTVALKMLKILRGDGEQD